ncbi:MAG: RNA chaperone Hfq [Nitrospirae bacterium]|nr:RNA chaperone Hfq [Nitrospirota bacterium]
MSKSSINLQDHFLNYLRKEKTPVTVHLLNGSRITGTIRAFDNFSILVKGDSQHLIYKHSVAVIVPKKEIREFDVRENEEKKSEEVVNAAS